MYRLEHESIHVSKIKLTNTTFFRKLFASPYIRLCLAVKGSAIWQIENRCVSINAGEIVLLNPLQKKSKDNTARRTGD